MELLSESTRRTLSRWDGRPRQVLALLCAAAAVIAVLGGRGADAGQTARPESTSGVAAERAAGDLTAGHVAAVLPAGPAALAIAPGDRVDVYAAAGGAAGLLDGGSWAPAADLVASAARVLSIDSTPVRSGSGEPAGYVVLELPDDAARALAARADARLTLVVRARDG